MHTVWLPHHSCRRSCCTDTALPLSVCVGVQLKDGLCTPRVRRAVGVSDLDVLVTLQHTAPFSAADPVLCNRDMASSRTHVLAQHSLADSQSCGR